MLFAMVILEIMEIVMESPVLQRSFRSLVRTCNGESLDVETAHETLLTLLDQDEPQTNIAWGMLSGAIMTRGGPTLDEAIGFIQAIEDFSGGPPQRLCTVSKKAVTMLGSGKDYPKTINLTTASALVAASLGVRVVKPVSESSLHNRSSQQVVRDLGLRVDHSAGAVHDSLQKRRICFVSFGDALSDFYDRYTGYFFAVHPLSFFLAPWATPLVTSHLFYGLAHRDVDRSARLLSTLLSDTSSLVVASVDGNDIIDEALPCSGLRLATWNSEEPTIPCDVVDQAPSESFKAVRTVDGMGAKVLRRVLRGTHPATSAVSLNVGLVLAHLHGSACLREYIEAADQQIVSGRALEFLDKIVV